MLKVNADNKYKAVERVYSGSTEIDKILDKNGNVLFAVNKEVEGTPAITYTGKEETNLKNYRIYGNTVNGESIGDRTANLWNEDYENISQNSPFYEAIYVGDGYFTLSTTAPLNANSAANLFLMSGDVQIGASTATTGVWSGHNITVESVNGYITVAYRYQYYVDPRDYNTMLNSGSTALPYEPYGYKVSVTVSNGTDTLTTPIYLPEPIKMVGDEAEYIDYAEQKLHRVRKNLLQNTATSQTKNGVTFTVNADKSITCNGTTTNTIYFAVKDNVVLESGTYVLTGCPLDGGKNTFKLYAQTPGGTIFYVDEGAGAIINYTSKIRVLITILSGYTCNNLTFYPMIRKADIEDNTYEPYIENTDLDVTLPALPTLSGTNTLSVGTEVQPSNVYLKGRIKEVSV